MEKPDSESSATANNWFHFQTQQLEEIEKYYQSTCKPSILHSKLISSSTSTSTSINVENSDQWLNKYSPRELMSSLQLNCTRSSLSSPPYDDNEEDGEMILKSKGRQYCSYDDMLVELLRERKGAIESGKLKGRRLFVDDVGGEISEMGENEMSDGDDDEVCSECINDLMNEESEERSVGSYGNNWDCDDHENMVKNGGIGKEFDGGDVGSSSSSSNCSSSSSSLCDEDFEEKEKMVEVVMGREKKMMVKSDNGDEGGKGDCAMDLYAIAVVIVLFVFAAAAAAVVVIFVMAFNGDDTEGALLVAT